jgi:predicted HTH domain antitoxin
MEVKPIKEILPAEGIWSLEDMSKYLGMRPDDLQQKLTDNGIKVLHLGTRYKARLIRLEDLKASK